jgi:pyruvate dehydrogenase E1 component alpha subunit
VCENNKLAIHSPVERRWATLDICHKVNAYGVTTRKISNGDVFEIYNTTQLLINQLRLGNGPAFIECDTYRYLEHVGPSDDHHEKYRNSDEHAAWRERDQIDRLANMLEKTVLNEIDQSIAHSIQAAVELTKQSAFPTTEELFSHVYAD